MVNSGSSANLLMVAAQFLKSSDNWNRGEEVIVPAVSWSTTYAPLQQYGLKAVFVDIDRDTLNISVPKVAMAISDKTVAIFAVSLLGNPSPLFELRKLAEQHNLVLLEDNCEALGAQLGGKRTGTFGVSSSFSFFYSHHISTMEGGMILTADEEIYQLLLSLRAHGWTRELPTINHLSNKHDDPFFDAFRFVLPGYNLRPLELSASVGTEQLRKLHSFVVARRINAAHFVKIFAGDKRFRVQNEHGDSSWFGFSLLIEDDDLSRALVVSRLAASGIECRPIVAGNFVSSDAIRTFDYKVVDTLSNADDLHNNGFFVGNSHIDIRHSIDYLATILSKLY